MLMHEIFTKRAEKQYLQTSCWQQYASESFTDAVGKMQVCGKYMQMASLTEWVPTQPRFTEWTGSL